MSKVALTLVIHKRKSMKVPTSIGHWFYKWRDKVLLWQRWWYTAYFTDTGMMCVLRNVIRDDDCFATYLTKWCSTSSGHGWTSTCWAQMAQCTASSGQPNVQVCLTLKVLRQTVKNFAAALLMAANRWGDGEGIFNYTAEAKALLHEMVHKDEEEGSRGMFDPETTHLFVAEMDILSVISLALTSLGLRAIR